MAIDVRAKARYVPVSPFKARRVINLVRGKDAEEALDILRFMPHSAARPVYKLIASAIANAEENFGLNREDLYIYRIFADEGPTRKWRRFGREFPASKSSASLPRSRSRSTRRNRAF